MREQPARDWLSGAKRQWSTPEVRTVPITPEIIGHLRKQHPGSPVLAEMAKKSGDEN